MAQYAQSAAPQEKDMIAFGEGKYTNVFVTDQFSCGMLLVPPGKTAGYDGGHREADEVFFIAQGSVSIEMPTLNKTATAQQGEFILMPRNEPHIVTNTSSEQLRMVFVCCASPEEK